MAKIVAVCLSQQRGTKKESVAEGVLKEDYGLIGDAHAGTTRQVSLLAVESINRMRGQGMEIHPGDSAENLITEEIDLLSLPLGTRICIGKEIILEITQIGKEHQRPEFDLLPLDGVFARVIHGGVIKPGDEVRVQ
jgi:MOSC domain-containing protein YiiM